MNYRPIALLTRLYLLATAIFFGFRICLLATEIDRVKASRFVSILESFAIGVRFDLVVCGYILIIPAVIIFASDIAGSKKEFFYTFSLYWVRVFFTLSFFVCSIEIPYFNHFFSRFSVVAFQWSENADFVLKMIIQEPRYYWVIIPFVVSMIIFHKKTGGIFRKKNSIVISGSLWGKSIVYGAFFCLMILTMWGRFSLMTPIKEGTAYFCNDPLLNQLGLNPMFTLSKSYLFSKDKRNQTVNLMDNSNAIHYVQKSLKIKYEKYNSPIARDIKGDSTKVMTPNVVFVIMESMSASLMKQHGNKRNITPFLDSISKKSVYFRKIYSSGIHTYNGVFSTLFSLPALYLQHPMRTMRKHFGIASVLKQKGYTTTFLTTHDGEFDNMSGFLHHNDFENIYTESNYPTSEVKSVLGVPDDYLFEYGVSVIDKLSLECKPFFTVFLTSSNHPPFYLPSYFKSKRKKATEEETIVEYSDWSLKKFMNLASKKEWFQNTIFVFLADHGQPLRVIYDISLDYHHSPLIFFAPNYLKPKVYNNIGGQIDAFPTLMGMLNLPYVNNTMGIDLIREKRPYIYINDDNKFSILDETSLLTVDNSGKALGLYNYNRGDSKNYLEVYPKKAKKMQLYGKSHMQVFQYMMLNGKTKISLPSELHEENQQLMGR